MGMRVEPMIFVRDVPASSRFYQAALGAEGAHGGDEYEQIVREGELLLQLHHWDTHEHGALELADDVPVGNGVTIWLRTDTFDTDVARLRAAGVALLEEPHVNGQAGHRECLFADPDGYKIALASRYGDL